MGTEWVKFPLEPFENHLIATIGKSSERLLAQLAGVSTKTVQIGRRRGVSFGIADKLATSINRHPQEIWPDAYERLDQRAERTSRRRSERRRRMGWYVVHQERKPS